MAYLELYLEDRTASATTRRSAGAAATSPALSFVAERAEHWLVQDLERRWPRVVRDVQDLVSQWPETDRFATRGATVGDVLADSRLLRAAVRNRFASAPRWALLAACDEAAVETPDAYAAVQAAVRDAGITLPAAAGVAATAAGLETLGLLCAALPDHLDRLASQTSLPGS